MGGNEWEWANRNTKQNGILRVLLHYELGRRCETSFMNLPLVTSSRVTPEHPLSFALAILSSEELRQQRCVLTSTN